MKLHISNSNSKIGKIPNMSLVPKVTCPNHHHCSQKPIGLNCYASKAYKQYPNVRQAWTDNTTLAQSSLAEFKFQLVKYLTKTNKGYFRIHVAGDFFNQEYLDIWADVCRDFPHIKFLAFTKSFHLDFSNIPTNLRIIWSIMPNMPELANAGSRAYTGPIDQGRDQETIHECQGHCDQCGICWDIPKNHSVHFKIH